MPQGRRRAIGQRWVVFPQAKGCVMNWEEEQVSAGMVTVAPVKQQSPRKDKRRQPRYNVLLWDSDDHTFEYVEKMLRELFGHEKEQCKEIAKTVDKDGKAVVLTTTLEHAELKRDQIHAYGKDNLEGSKGSMWSTIEPVG
jgi:ATP-dependent Clp protease adaptor protein ClpS